MGQKSGKNFKIFVTMRVHFFTKGNKDAGSSRQRAFLIAEELNKKGIRSVVHHPPLILTSRTPWPKTVSYTHLTLPTN